MSMYSVAAPEAAVGAGVVAGQTYPPAEAPNVFVGLEERLDTQVYPGVQTPEDAERFNGADFAEPPVGLQTGAPVSIKTETTANQTAAPKGWLSRIRRAAKAGGEWVADQRARAAYTIGAAAAAMAVGEGEETLDALEVKGTLGGVLKGFIELIGNTQASEHIGNAGALSAASVSVIGLGLVMRKGMSRVKRAAPADTAISEPMTSRWVRSSGHDEFQRSMARYQHLIYETDNEIQSRAAEAYAMA